MIHKTYKKNLYSQGYALMLSIVVSSIVLSIGLSLFNIVQKELILSGTGRDSQFAFYSADGGVECALYWDIKKLAFSANLLESNFDETPPPPGGAGDTECGTIDFGSEGYSGTITDVNGDTRCVIVDDEQVCSGETDDIAEYDLLITFQDSTSDSPGSCALVTITKDDPDDGLTEFDVVTTIESKGYNADCAHVTSDNPMLVERAISVVY